MTVAESATVAPTFIVAVGGLTVTVVTTGGGDATVMLELPDFPAHVAVIVAEPAATPVTMPVELTVAAAALLVDQVTVCPVITFPCASLTVAVRVAVAPTFIVAVGGVTVTVVTTGAGDVTVTLAVPVFPAHVAVIVAEPAAIPVTKPLELTVATFALLVVHVTV